MTNNIMQYDSACFIKFMLSVILDAFGKNDQVSDQVSDQAEIPEADVISLAVQTQGYK